MILPVVAPLFRVPKVLLITQTQPGRTACGNIDFGKGLSLF